jgi:hypothetical protein
MFLANLRHYEPQDPELDPDQKRIGNADPDPYIQNTDQHQQA